MILPRTLSLLLVFWLLPATFPQGVYGASAGLLTGTIKSGTGESLLGAVVSLLAGENMVKPIFSTRSDPRGAFAFKNVEPGSYLLQVRREGYPTSRSQVTINPGKTTNLSIVLQDFLDIIDSEDPRNWDLRTVIRRSSTRRLIFRHSDGPQDGSILDRAHREASSRHDFARTATVNVASSAGFSHDNYAVFPRNDHIGIDSNFAFSEPFGHRDRLIFAGQFNSGYDTLWRVRNIYQHRGEYGQDFKLSLGYGRLTHNSPGISAVGHPSGFFQGRNVDSRNSGLQTMNVGFESSTQILDLVTLDYGVDFTRVSYGNSESVFSPFFQIVVAPLETWTVRAAMASRRPSDYNTIRLPDGEAINLMEPTYLAQINGDVHLSQFKHYEIAVAKELATSTSLELALYEDRMIGSGLPFLATEVRTGNRDTFVAQLSEDQSAHHGLRVALRRKILEIVNGSFAYVYGTGAAISDKGHHPLATTVDGVLDYFERSYVHSFTSLIEAKIPITKTNVTTIVRWHPGTVFTPIDLFYDTRDTLSKSMNVFIRQVIPLPEFMGTAGRWEAMVDLRNVLDQGKHGVPTNEGQLLLARSPRTVRFGLNLNLY